MSANRMITLMSNQRISNLIKVDGTTLEL